jgi:hypothetical protein
MWKLAHIWPYENNPRRHPPEQLALLAASMRDEGVTMPILVDEAGIIIAGHGRLAAAQQNGFEEYPVVIARGWSDEKKRAARIRDNSVALLSTWDAVLITSEIQSLKLAGYDIPLLGFPETQLRGWGIAMGTDSEQDPEAVPDPPKKPVVRRGDLWTLDDHRLLVGDALADGDVKRLLSGALPDLANCDPPYGISIVKGVRSSVGGAKPFGSVGGKRLATDPKHIGNFRRGNVHSPGPDGFKRGRVHGPARRAINQPGMYDAVIGDDTTETAIAAYSTLLRLQIPIIVLWGANYYANALPPSRCWLVWDKETTGTFADVELAWTNQDRVAKLLRHQWNGLMKASERGQRRFHPTQKPVALAEWVIETMAPKAKTALDLFIGSGSMLIACERKNVQFFGMELAPSYVEQTILRWQNLTGHVATLDGKTLDQVAKARRKGKSKREKAEDVRDVRIARKRLAEIKEHPERLVSGDELRRRLGEF